MDFLAELEDLVNRHSQEKDIYTPDFLLAAYLYDCLQTWNKFVKLRDKWIGVNQPPSPGLLKKLFESDYE